MCTFLLQKVHCGITVWCVVGYMIWIYWNPTHHANTMCIFLAVYCMGVNSLVLLTECHIKVVASKCLGTIPEQNPRHLADILKSIFCTENVHISIKISSKCIQKGSIGNKATLVEIMAWYLSGDKPLPGPMQTQFIASLGPSGLNPGIHHHLLKQYQYTILRFVLVVGCCAEEC